MVRGGTGGWWYTQGGIGWVYTQHGREYTTRHGALSLVNPACCALSVNPAVYRSQTLTGRVPLSDVNPAVRTPLLSTRPYVHLSYQPGRVAHLTPEESDGSRTYGDLPGF